VGAEFDGILTGYLASAAQAELALELIGRFGEKALVIQDPAMADHGRLYSGLGPELVEAHRRICARADLVIPNLTEGCMLAGVEYEDRTDLEFCRQIATALLQITKAVLLTGYSPSPDTLGFYYSDGQTEFAHAGPRYPRSCHGTGDLFAAVVMGGCMGGLTVPQAGRLAAEFIHRSIAKTGENSRFGVAFEGELGWLAGQGASRRFQNS
jgi:pyridoxine kinase